MRKEKKTIAGRRNYLQEKAGKLGKKQSKQSFKIFTMGRKLSGKTSCNQASLTEKENEEKLH